MVARVTPGRLDVFLETPFRAGSFRGFGRRGRNLRMQEEGGGSAAASPESSGGAGRPEGRAGLRGVDRHARRLRQRRDPARRSRATCSARSTGRASLSRPARLLFEIDPRQFQAALDQAKGTLAQYEATLANAKTTVARYRPSRPRRPSASRSSTTPRRRSARRRPTSRARAAALEQAKLDLGWTKVVSPIDGIAGIAKSQVGDLVNGQTVMTTVSQVDPDQGVLQPERAGIPGLGRQVRAAGRRSRATRNLEKGPLELILADGSVFPHRGKAFLVGREVDVKTGTIQLAGPSRTPATCCGPASTQRSASQSTSGRARSSFPSARSTSCRAATRSRSSARTTRRRSRS